MQDPDEMMQNFSAAFHLHFPTHGFTLCIPMEYSIKFDTVTVGWSIVYTEGSAYYFQKYLISVSED